MGCALPGIAAALSSTVIIVKMLYDKRELDTLPGRITLGILVLQDLFVIVFLAIQPELGRPRAGAFILSLVRVVVLVASSLAISRFVLPPLFRSVARLPELVLVGALAWCFGRRARRAHGAFPRDGSANRRRVDLDIPLRARCHCESHQPERFFVTLFSWDLE